MPVIKLDNITKRYDEKVIFNKFSMEVSKGEFTAIMGDSGSGKSTLLNIIGLLEDFDQGSLDILGNKNLKPNSFKAGKILRENISYLFQNFALVDDETVEYNLSIAMKYVKGSKKDKKIKIKEALDNVGLAGFERRHIFELSGGEQQRAAIARIMLKPSNIILADEPTGSLDEKNRDIVIELLKKLNEDGKTILLVTHDKYVAGQCHRVMQLT